MRISDSQFSQIMLNSLQANNAGLGKVLQQMSTSDRLTHISDDPMASIKLLNLERESTAINQYQSNIANVKTTLSRQEAYLDSMNESLKSIRDLVLWGANGTLTDVDRDGMISELKSLKDSVESSLNAQDEEGHYLFSGTQSHSPAISRDGSLYAIDGNTDKRMVVVAKGVTMESNITAMELIGLEDNHNVLNQIDKLISEFSTPSEEFSATVEATLQAINNTSINVLSSMTEIGGRYNNLDLLNSAHSENKLFVDKVTSDLSALDYGEASVRLSNYLGALQATQASYVKINELSLFDRL
ncbi:flagellar hook-associated protein FlgL [Vibrio metschnikovii]|uniref:flagellar hook-associated protein FlgL n=1 Tax=Vibrio metschnikovii TaxID=28172 RepID=UPI002FC9AE8F